MLPGPPNRDEVGIGDHTRGAVVMGGEHADLLPILHYQGFESPSSRFSVGDDLIERVPSRAAAADSEP